MAKRAEPSTNGENTAANRITSVVLLVLAVVCLISAQVSMWVKNVIFDKDAFTNITVPAVLEQESRDALSRYVVDEIYQDRPLAKQVAGDRTASLMSGLLASDIGERLLSGLTLRAHAYVTSPNPEDIALQTGAVRDHIAAVTTIFAKEDGTLQTTVDAIPDEVVLLRASDVPNVNHMYRAFLWLAPLFWLLSAGLFAAYIALGKKRYAGRVYWACLAVAGSTAIVLFAANFLPESVGSLAASSHIGVIISNIAERLLQPFTAQLTTTIAIAAIIAIAFSLRGHAARLVLRVVDKLKPAKS